MSSVAVRTSFKTFLSANSAENFADMTGIFDLLPDFLTQNGITSDDPWVGIQFVGSDEIPITVGSGNLSGKYREVGTVQLHVVDVAKLGASDSILARAETLRTLLRGQVIDGIIVEAVTPPNFSFGATLEFDGGWQSATFTVAFHKDLDI